MFKRLLTPFVLTILLYSNLAYAGKLEDAQGAIDGHDSATALKILSPLAENGDVKAQIMLGQMYSSQAETSLEAAARWYYAAATQGNPEGEREFGMMVETGLGTGGFSSPTKAFNWFSKAAEQGDGPAQCRLGGMYQDGKGVKQDPVEAFFWLRLCVAKMGGNADSAAVAKMLTPEQKADVDKRVKEWKPTPTPDVAAPSSSK